MGLKKGHLSFKGILPSGYITYGGIHGQNLALKWLNEGFSRNTIIFFYFFMTIFIETWTKKIAVFTYFLEQELETCGGIHINRGIFGGVGRPTPDWAGPAGCKASNSTKNFPIHMNTTTSFKFLLQKIRENHHLFVQVSMKPSKKKKYDGVSTETLI